jgi:hypothetical protein
LYFEPKELKILLLIAGEKTTRITTTFPSTIILNNTNFTTTIPITKSTTTFTENTTRVTFTKITLVIITDHHSNATRGG